MHSSPHWGNSVGSTPPRKVFCAAWLRQSCNDRGGDEGTGSENTASIWEDTHYAAHTPAEITHHEEESPVTVQFSFRIRRAYNPK